MPYTLRVHLKHVNFIEIVQKVYMNLFTFTKTFLNLVKKNSCFGATFRLLAFGLSKSQTALIKPEAQRVILMSF